MSNCIETAMRASAFGLVKNDSGDDSVNLFMVNEAESGASYALASRLNRGTIKCMQVFLLIDSGGGTTDLGIYRNTEQHPLRLEQEINPPSGAMCGSSDLNERMRALALKDLHDQYSLGTSQGIERTVEREILTTFEGTYKRMFKYRDTTRRFSFFVRGLQASKDNPRLLDGEYRLDYDDMWKIFEPSLTIIRDLNITVLGGLEALRVLDVGATKALLAENGRYLRDKIVNEEADNIAERFNADLAPFFVDGLSTDIVSARQAALRECARILLALKFELLLADKEYEFHFVAAGCQFDPGTMVAVEYDGSAVGGCLQAKV